MKQYETKTPGTLYTCRINELANAPATAIKLLIVASAKTVPEGTKVVSALAPPQELFQRWYRDWRGQPGQTWWPEYEKAFKTYMESECFKKIASLAAQRLTEGRDIILACYCADDEFCHRRLVAEYIAEYIKKEG